ncbi:metallopeptidase, zinc binding [Erythrobacter sp. NAP1]|uniref:KPN_02809 family neutral zinc metallopeptidase n=1 Tax=Erythrobacter sp. NAP1 TaxID=237727 RepID=UPI0000686AEF|nr:neutral zinc metallopeptidase [Erythrobacter sp. NAP1]EAQ30376.1 metallopeptidase, zinc binding [Erythrobacter sp. NAP1]
MRLNPFNTNKINVGTTGGARRAGGVGCVGIVIALVGAVVFGVDPRQTLGLIEGVQQTSGSSQAPQNEDETAICSSNAYANETCAALTSLNETWARTFAQQNVEFRQPSLRFATSQRFDTACGPASTGMGPFYCPANETIYIDTGFYDQLARMSGERGDFARLYVVAHEFGHHIQTITGISGQIRSLQASNPRSANQLSVLMELQADCYAGVWAGKNRNLLEPGDMQEGLRAASAIGDDTLQQRSGRRANPETFTHGTSRQRQEALQLGLRGDDRACDEITQLR